MIITTNYFKSMFSIDLADEIVLEAITLAAKWFSKLTSTQNEIKYGSSLTTSTIQLFRQYPVSEDVNNEFSIKDIELFEMDVNYNVTQLNNHLTGANVIKTKDFNILKLTYDIPLPITTGNTLYIRYKTSSIDYYDTKYIDTIRRIISLKAFNNIKDTLMIMLNQQGINSFDLNGVSISADNQGMDELVKANELTIQRLYNDMMPITIAPARSGNLRSRTTRRI